jgi:hypothetical protein
MFKPFDADAVWRPKDNNKDQYLQVDLGNLEPLYGTAVWGNPKEDEYVTSYMVLYSDNGQHYTYVTDEENAPAVRIVARRILITLAVILSQLYCCIIIICCYCHV